MRGRISDELLQRVPLHVIQHRHDLQERMAFLDDGPEDRLLGGEVVVDATQRHMRVHGDLPHGSGRKALLDDQAIRAVEDGPPSACRSRDRAVWLASIAFNENERSFGLCTQGDADVKW